MGPNLEYKLVNRKLDLYGEEAWNKAHTEAMACLDLEDMLSLSIQIYDDIIMLDEKVRSDEYESKPSADNGLMERLEHQMQRWTGTSERVLKILEWLAHSYSIIKGADDFRQRLQEARSICTKDEQFFHGEKLIRLEAKALAQHEANLTEAW